MSIKELKRRVQYSTVHPILGSEEDRVRRREAIEAYLKAINYPKIRFYYKDTTQTTVTTWARDVFTAKVARELEGTIKRITHIAKD